jgi:hypothetical protein
LLARAKTYEGQCLAIHGLGHRLPVEFVQAFNAKHGPLVAHAAVISVVHLTDPGLIPRWREKPASHVIVQEPPDRIVRAPAQGQ